MSLTMKVNLSSYTVFIIENEYEYNINSVIYKQEPPFGAKICSDICPRTLSVPRSMRTVFRERSSRKTMSCKEQIMSKDKYPSTFSPQVQAIVFIILQIFFAKRTFFKIGEYSRIFPSFSWGIFGDVTRLALNCNSRWRHKGSKFDSIPYKPFKICSGSFSSEPAQNQRFIWGSIKLSSFIFRLGITIKR